MPIPRDLRSFLKEHHIRYRSLYHPSIYTAQQLAHIEHMKGQKVAKSVVLKAGDEFILAVLPAAYKVDFTEMKKVLGKNELRLGTETEIRQLFPDCEIGAIPPFGNLYRLKVFADESLRANDEIIFSVGTHREAVQMKYRDFEEAVAPTVARFAVHL
ncbi:MAG: YbaK/EbsC family protein [Deltaproteobacteria bacterium]